MPASFISTLVVSCPELQGQGVGGMGQAANGAPQALPHLPPASLHELSGWREEEVPDK